MKSWNKYSQELFLKEICRTQFKEFLRIILKFQYFILFLTLKGSNNTLHVRLEWKIIGFLDNPLIVNCNSVSNAWRKSSKIWKKIEVENWHVRLSETFEAD